MIENSLGKRRICQAPRLHAALPLAPFPPPAGGACAWRGAAHLPYGQRPQRRVRPPPGHLALSRTVSGRDLQFLTWRWSPASVPSCFWHLRGTAVPLYGGRITVGYLFCLPHLTLPLAPAGTVISDQGVSLDDTGVNSERALSTCRWSKGRKERPEVEGEAIEHITVAGRTSAFVPRLQVLQDGDAGVEDALREPPKQEPRKRPEPGGKETKVKRQAATTPPPAARKRRGAG